MSNTPEPVQHVFVCGAKSIGQYGGFETFADKLTESLQKDARVKLHVLCKANGEGCMDEKRLSGVRRIGENEFEYHNAHCIKLTVPNMGPAAAVCYDLASVRWVLDYCVKNAVPHPIVYVLACRIGPFAAGLKRRLRALGGTLHVNPDGHEWMRQKWSAPVRRYWKLSERLMVKQADLLVCDSVNIETYIRTEYRRFSPKTTYIAYGADVTPSPLADDDPLFLNWLCENGLRPRSYYLVVGRLVPENNYETMIREFMRSSSERNLALITNANEPFLRTLEKRLRFSSDPRIKFTGAVYDPALLRKIRENAWAYFHGHEVGGTNPSLLEGLGSTDVSLLLDVGFNREVGQEAALYWTKEPGNLAGLIERTDQMPPRERARLSAQAKRRVRENYSWERIASRYREIWEIESEHTAERASPEENRDDT